MVSDLHVAVAKYSLGLIHSWELPAVADLALQQGWCSDTLAYLATIRDPIMSDVGPLFETCLSELTIQLPERSSAIWTVVTHVVRLIADGAVTPYAGLRELADIYCGARLDQDCIKFAGDSHGIQEFLGVYYGYDDVRSRELSSSVKRGREAVAALDAYVVDQAKLWLTQHAT